MKKKLKIICLFVLLFSCQTQIEKPLTKNKSDNDHLKNESEFLLICKNLPVVNLPFSVYCENCCSHPQLSSEQEKINSYLPEGSSIVGLIDLNDSFATLLTTYPADLIIPAVITFDFNGNKIDEEVFLGGYCGNDLEFRGQNHFSISSDLTLIEKDTSYYFKRDSESLDILDTIKTEIETKKYKMNKRGEIKSL